MNRTIAGQFASTRLGMKTLLGILAVLMFGVATSSARATTIVEVNAGSSASSSTAYWGESLTTPTGGPWKSLGFTFLSTTDQPSAVGTLYVLSQQYLGTPNNLSGSTPGFLATGSSSSGVWTFPAALTIQPSTQYFLYPDASFPSGSLSGSSSYAGGQYYLAAAGGNSAYGPGGSAIDFRLTGTVVPEPTTGVLGLLALASFGLLARRLRKFAR